MYGRNELGHGRHGTVVETENVNGQFANNSAASSQNEWRLER